MAKFVRYKHYWWKYNEKTNPEYATLTNWRGEIAKGVNINYLYCTEAQDFNFLDWRGTPVLDYTSRYGWLDRNGKFYGCVYTEHAAQAILVHHSTRRELEELGWIHISKSSYYDNSGKLVAQFCGDYENGVMPTDEQMIYLLKRNDVDNTSALYAYENGNEAKAKVYEEKLKNNNERQL